MYTIACGICSVPGSVGLSVHRHRRRRPFVCLFVCSFFRSFVRLFCLVLLCLFVCWFVCLCVSFVCFVLVCLLGCPFVCLFLRLFCYLSVVLCSSQNMRLQIRGSPQGVYPDLECSLRFWPVVVAFAVGLPWPPVASRRPDWECPLGCRRNRFVLPWPPTARCHPPSSCLGSALWHHCSFVCLAVLNSPGPRICVHVQWELIVRGARSLPNCFFGNDLGRLLEESWGPVGPKMARRAHQVPKTKCHKPHNVEKTITL